MPTLQGENRILYQWFGTFITQYDVMNLIGPIRVAYTYLISNRIKDISWQLGENLVQRQNYLHGITEVRLIENNYYGIDLLIQMLIQPFAEQPVGEDVGYWTAKFAERLMFDLMAYVGKQIPPIEISRTELGLSPAELAGKEVKKFNEQQMMPKPEPIKWKIINKGKI